MTYEDEVLADSPVAYYPMDETSGSTLNDKSGNGHDGAIQNNPTLDQPGFNNNTRSILFNGAYERVDINTTAVANHPETVEGWARFTGDQSTNGGASVCNDRESTGVQLTLTYDRDGWQWAWEGTNDGYESIYDEASFSYDTWHHVVGTHDGSTARLYVDGTEVNNYSGKDFTPRSSGECTIAANDSNTSTERYFVGYISGVALYDKELSASRIQAHYDAANATEKSTDHTTQAVLQLEREENHTTHAHLVNRSEEPYTTSAYLAQYDAEKTHTSSAVLQTTPTRTHTTHAHLLETQTLTHTSSAVLVARQTLTHTTSSHVVIRTTLAHNTSAHVYAGPDVRMYIAPRLYYGWEFSGLYKRWRSQ